MFLKKSDCISFYTTCQKSWNGRKTEDPLYSLSPHFLHRCWIFACPMSSIAQPIFCRVGSYGIQTLAVPCLPSFNTTLICLLALLLTPFSSHPALLTCCISMSTIAFDLPYALLMFFCNTSFWCAFCHVPPLVWFVSASVVPNEAKAVPPLFFVSQINCVLDKVSFSKCLISYYFPLPLPSQEIKTTHSEIRFYNICFIVFFFFFLIAFTLSLPCSF